MSCKQISFLAISFSLATITACAQAQTELDTLMPGKFIKQIQFFAGPNISNSWGSNSIHDQVINIQPCAGLGLSHPLHKSFDLQAKLVWEVKGSKMDYQATFYDQNNEPLTWRFIQGNRLEYLTGSLILNYYFEKRHKFYGGVGMSLSYLLKQETYTKQFDISSGNQISYYKSKTYAYRDLDAGCVAVIGFNHKLGPKTFFTIQVLGIIGIVDIVRPEISHYYETVKNYSVALLVGITLNN